MQPCGVLTSSALPEMVSLNFLFHWCPRCVVLCVILHIYVLDTSSWLIEHEFYAQLSILWLFQLFRVVDEMMKLCTMFRVPPLMYDFGLVVMVSFTCDFILTLLVLNEELCVHADDLCI